MSTRRAVTYVAFAIIVVGVVVAAFRGGADDPQARAQRLEQRIACPICDGESVAESNASISREIRADIEQRIEQGQTDDEIMAYYRAKYERYILNPSDSGLGLVAWGLPVVGIVAAGAGVGFAIRRWRSEPRLVATTDDDALVERTRAQ